MALSFPFLRYRLGLPGMCSIIGRVFRHPRTMFAAIVFGLFAWFGVLRRSLPQRPPGESNDLDLVTDTVSTEVTEGEVEPSVIHRDATPSVGPFGSEGEVEATPSAVGKRAADPTCQESHDDDVGSVKRPRTEEDVDEEEFERSEYLVDYTDEFCCEYDSTWEMSRSHSQSTGRPRSSNYQFGRFRNAAKDMQNFRHNYPREIKTRYKQRKQDENRMPNLDFYLRKRASSPDGIYIDDFHNEWSGDYYKLESAHTFIQWLFPLQEPGVNNEAVTLTKKEIKAFLEDDVAKANLLKSYELMLDFYGIELCNVKTGEVQRASNCEERFANLNRNTHNSLRITRILKCLGTLGFAHYQAPLVRFFLHEALVNEVLPAVKESVLNYFLFAVLDKRRRRSLIKFAYKNYKPREDFVWCPRKIQMAMDAQLAHSSQTSKIVCVDERAEKREVSDVNLYHNEASASFNFTVYDMKSTSYSFVSPGMGAEIKDYFGSSSSTEPVERYSDMHEKPINHSPTECSLPSQDDLPAEFEETGELGASNNGPQRPDREEEQVSGQGVPTNKANGGGGRQRLTPVDGEEVEEEDEEDNNSGSQQGEEEEEEAAPVAAVVLAAEEERTEGGGGGGQERARRASGEEREEEEGDDEDMDQDSNDFEHSENVNPKPIHPNSADGSNDNMAEKPNECK